MTTNADTKNNPTGDSNPDSSAAAPAAAASASEPQNNDSKDIKNDSAGTPSPGLSEEEVNARIEKARADEKKKAYAKVEDASTKIAKLEEDLQSATANLDELRKGKSSEVDSITDELKQLREKNEKLEEAITVVATDAAKELHESKVATYREKVIRDQKIELAEMVNGATFEEIDVAADRALKREAELKAKFETSAKKQPAPDNVPRPVAPDGSQGRDPSMTALDPQNREALSKLPPEEYKKQRDELLANAKRKTGLI